MWSGILSRVPTDKREGYPRVPRSSGSLSPLVYTRVRTSALFSRALEHAPRPASHPSSLIPPPPFSSASPLNRPESNSDGHEAPDTEAVTDHTHFGATFVRFWKSIVPCILPVHPPTYLYSNSSLEFTHLNKSVPRRLCSLLLSPPAMPLRRPRGRPLALLGLAQPFDASASFVTSYLCSPSTLAGIRLLLALYTFITIFYALIWNASSINQGDKFFAYFTHLTYIGICSYYWASGIQTVAYALRLRKLKQGPGGGGEEERRGSEEDLGGDDYQIPAQYPLQRWPRALQLLHVWLQSTVCTFPIVVTIVYWAILSSSATFSTTNSSWQAVSLHILNTPLGLLDALLTNIQPAPWIYVLLNVIILALYLSLAYVANKAVGLDWYPYSFLNPKAESHGLLAGYVIGIAVGYAIVFVVVRLVMMLKAYLLRRSRASTSGRLGGDGSQNDVAREPEAMEEWEVVEAPVTVRRS